MEKIIITEFIWPPAIEQLRQHGEVIADAGLWGRAAELQALLAGATALIVRNQTQVGHQLLHTAPQLKVVGRLGVGLDNIDLAACRERGVRVVFGRSANAVAVAEYVFAAMLSAQRRLSAATASVRSGGWERQAFTGGELSGKTLGIVGLGDIGGRLAHRAQAFGMRVLAADPLATSSSFAVAEFGVQLVSLEELLGQADFISLHVPLTPATNNLLNSERLALCKPGAWLINTARGAVIDEAALATALAEGKLGGAALDVRTHEPPAGADQLSELPNVILTPHIAGLTIEAGQRTAQMVADDVLRVLRGEAPLSAVV